MDNTAKYFQVPSTSVSIFSSDVLIKYLGKNWTAKAVIEKLKATCHIIFRHVIKLKLVLHQLLTSQGMIVLHFRNRSK
jgi:hypothetical protein